jgi:type I restriction enzyme M protein
MTNKSSPNMPPLANFTQMITGEIKSKVERIWGSLWIVGVSNPLDIIEQLPYLLFIKRLDEIHTLKENKATSIKYS